MPPVIHVDRCSACGTCVNVCPQDVFFGSKKKAVPAVTYSDECWHCNACVLDCPESAIELNVPLPMLMCYTE